MKLLIAVSLALQTVLAIPAQVVMMNSETTNVETSLIEGKFIVTLKAGISLVKHQQEFLDKFDSINEDIKVNHRYMLPEFSGYSIEVTDASLLVELQSHEDVHAIEQDRIVSVAAVQQNAQWNINRISQRNLPVGNTYSYADEAGQGVDAYVLDSGIWYSHSEFSGRAKFGATFVSGPEQDDPLGHGTHVAGIIGGNTFGVAKKVNLIGVQVLDANGSGAWSSIIAGINWAYKAAVASKRPSVLNLSISGPKSDAVNAAINACVKRGVHVVVAAGNSGKEACKESPASAAYAITVGSTDKDDKISSFSNYGSCVDILAPGENILSAYTGNNYAAAWDSGTSMASPHVAGVKALWLSEQTSTTLATLDTILRKSATTNKITGLNRFTRNMLLFSNPPTNLSFDKEEEAEIPDNEGDVPDEDIPEAASNIEYLVAGVQTFFDNLQN